MRWFRLALILAGLTSVGSPAALSAGGELGARDLERVLPGPDTSARLEALARAGRWSDAVGLAEHALLNLGSTDTPDSVDIVRVVDVLTESLLLWIPGSAAAPAVHQPDSAAVADRLREIALPTYHRGAIRASRFLFERIRQIRVACLPRLSEPVADAHNKLAHTHYDLGDYASARPLYEEALAIRRAMWPAESLAVRGTMLNLANVRYLAGDHAEARALYQQVVDLGDRVGNIDGYVAGTLYTMSILVSEMGDHREALRLQRRGRSLCWAGDGWCLGQSALAIGATLCRLGDLEGARTMLDSAQIELRRVTRPDAPDFAEVFLTLAEVAMREGNLAEARRHCEESLRIRESTMGMDNLAMAPAMIQRGAIARGSGDALGARQDFERALAIRRSLLPPHHPGIAENLIHVAEARLATGDSLGALASAFEAETLGVRHLRYTARSSTERQALRLEAVRASGLGIVLSLAAAALEGLHPELVLDAVIRSRAVVLDELAKRQRAVGESPEVGRLLHELDAASSRLAALTFRSPKPADREGYSRQVASAFHDRERAERAVAEHSARFRQDRIHSEIGLREVAGALTPRSALVSYVSYERVGEGATDRERRYLAFVVRPDRKVRIVPLGASAGIDTLVNRWRAGVTTHRLDRTRRGRAAGAALRRSVWDPVAAHLGDAALVFVVPDGALQLVNLSALPVGASGYLIEGGPLVHYLSAERDLAAMKERSASGSGLVAMGGVDFERAGSTMASSRPAGSGDSVPAIYRTAPSTCAAFSTMRFDPLPHSRREAETVASLWRAGAPAASRGPVLTLTGAEASEAAFKSVAPGRRVAHVATHGFFMGEACAPAPPGRDPGGEFMASESVVVENPLLQSGLALAGFNARARAAAGVEDGVLTADEIAAMDLSGVEWVVLSACNSGLGATVDGEGVLGLRRSLQMAGVGCSIMSLWPVSDLAASALMKELYLARFVRGKSTAEALRDAALALLKRQRARAIEPDPREWGAFIAAGDWR
jgi:CHAT domain-containing protein